MENVNTSKTRPSFFLHSKKARAQKAKEAAQKEMNPLNNLEKRKISQNKPKKANTAISIPEATKDFARIKKAVDNAQPLDKSEKIALLKKQIQNGQYKVDYEALADKILQSEF